MTESTEGVSDSGPENSRQSKERHGRFSHSKSKGVKEKRTEKQSPPTEKVSRPPVLLRTYRPRISISDSENIDINSSEHRCPANLCLCNENGPPESDEEYYERKEKHRDLISEVSKIRPSYQSGKTATLSRTQIDLLRYMGNLESINSETLRKYILAALLRLAPTGNPLQASMTTSSIRLSMAFYQALASKINQWTESTDISRFCEEWDLRHSGACIENQGSMGAVMTQFSESLSTSLQNLRVATNNLQNECSTITQSGHTIKGAATGLEKVVDKITTCINQSTEPHRCISCIQPKPVDLMKTKLPAPSSLGTEETKTLEVAATTESCPIHSALLCVWYQGHLSKYTITIKGNVISDLNHVKGDRLEGLDSLLLSTPAHDLGSADKVSITLREIDRESLIVAFKNAFLSDK